MPFCFRIETQSKGSFMINIHMCTDMPTNADPLSRDCKKPIVCKHKNRKALKLDLFFVVWGFNAFTFREVADCHAV